MDGQLENRLLEQRTRGMRGIRKISWSPTGTDIVFEQNNNIFKLDLTTGQIRQLTNNLGNCRNPAYLPDGRILFESNFDPATNQPAHISTSGSCEVTALSLKG